MVKFTMPKTKPMKGVHSYHPAGCIPILLTLPIGEVLDAIEDGDAGFEEMASAQSEMLRHELVRIVDMFKENRRSARRKAR